MSSRRTTDRLPYRVTWVMALRIYEWKQMSNVDMRQIMSRLDFFWYFLPGLNTSMEMATNYMIILRYRGQS